MRSVQDLKIFDLNHPRLWNACSSNAMTYGSVHMGMPWKSVTPASKESRGRQGERQGSLNNHVGEELVHSFHSFHSFLMT